MASGSGGSKGGRRQSTILTRIDSATTEIGADVKELKASVNELEATSREHKAILDEHMRRTAAAEENIELLRLRDEKRDEEVEDRIKPLEKHVAMWAGAGKVLAVLGTIAAIIGAVVKAVSVFGG